MSETTKYVNRPGDTAEIAVYLWLIEPRSRRWLSDRWTSHFNRDNYDLDAVLYTLRDEGLIAVFKSRDGESYWYRRDTHGKKKE